VYTAERAPLLGFGDNKPVGYTHEYESTLDVRSQALCEVVIKIDSLDESTSCRTCCMRYNLCVIVQSCKRY